MGAALRYWRLVTIGADGRLRRQEIPELKTFWQQQFPEFADAVDSPDSSIQRQLMQFLRTDFPAQENDRQYAEFCLRCFISNQIEQTCWQLEEKFGALHGIQAVDLFSFVLTDLMPLAALRPVDPPASPYRSLSTEILQTFDPTQSNLSTWTNRLVRSHPELKAFLLEHGIYLISDWALLNDTTSAQVQRILLEFHGLSETEIKQAAQLLGSYHAVYQSDRLQQRQAGVRGTCADPTSDQLTRIAQQLSVSVDRAFTPEQIKQDLQTLAQRLRDYRIAVRGKRLPTRSIDDANNPLSITEIPAPEPEESDPAQEFLTAYHQELQHCLTQAIASVLDDYVSRQQRKTPPTDRQFLKALYLFHCEGKSMGDIATQVGLKKQYEVTRLLKLKDLRADVRQELLLQLRDRVRELAQTYSDPIRLQQVDQQLEAILDEQIAPLIEAAAAEASVANRASTSQFARKLCSDLNRRGT